MPKRILDVGTESKIRFPETSTEPELILSCLDILTVFLVLGEAGKVCEFTISSFENGYEAELGGTYGAGDSPLNAVIALARNTNLI